MAEGKVEYDWTGKITSIGGEKVDYDLFGGRITSVGGETVEHGIFSDRITSIGGEQVEYGVFSDRITSIGDKAVDYDIFDRMTYVGRDRASDGPEIIDAGNAGTEASGPGATGFVVVVVIVLLLLAVGSFIFSARRFGGADAPSPAQQSEATTSDADGGTVAEPDQVPTDPAGPWAAGAVKVTASDLNLRDGPGTGYAIIRVLPQGTAVAVRSEPRDVPDGRWAEIDTPWGTGWVNVRFLRDS